MTTYICFLRGVNVGGNKMLKMAELKLLFDALKLRDAKTYLQSGNVVLESRAKPESVRKKVEGVIAERFGLEIAVVVRTRAELAAVVRKNPLGEVATDPKRHQVTFLSKKLTAKTVRELEETATPQERVVVAGREVYAWHPSGVARSKLWSKLAGKGLGVTATSRNWTTVEALLKLAGG